MFDCLVKFLVLKCFLQDVVRVSIVIFCNFIKANQIAFKLRRGNIFEEPRGVNNFLSGHKGALATNKLWTIFDQHVAIAKKYLGTADIQHDSAVKRRVHSAGNAERYV